jgi:hypothetical protein
MIGWITLGERVGAFGEFTGLGFPAALLSSPRFASLTHMPTPAPSEPVILHIIQHPRSLPSRASRLCRMMIKLRSVRMYEPALVAKMIADFVKAM